jgi:hypothetical protein
MEWQDSVFSATRNSNTDGPSSVHDAQGCGSATEGMISKNDVCRFDVLSYGAH